MIGQLPRSTSHVSEIQRLRRQNRRLLMLNRELKEQNSLLQQLVETSRVGMFAKDLNNRFIFANQTFCDHLQVSKDKILHKDPLSLSKAVRKYTSDDKKVLKTHHVIFNLIEDKDNKSWIETVKFPWIDQSNLIRGIFGFTYNVTDSILAEEGLRKTRTELKKADRVNEALRQFSYAASHDLQEPLRSAQGFLSLLRMEFDTELHEKALGYVNNADESLRRMQQLIKDILDYAVINGANYPFEIVDLNVLIEEVLQNLHQSIKEHSAHIYVDELPTVEGNTGLLNHFFQNMLSNALKYRSKKSDPEICIKAYHKKDKHIIGIEDNGIGIDPAYFEEIFKPFKRLHRRAEYQGSGIGLATSKKIVQIHSGKLWVESSPGDGATFFMELPKI